MSKALVYDSFFADPDGVRQYALGEKFWDCSFTSIMYGKWPGKRSHLLHWVSADIFDQLITRLTEALELSLDDDIYIEAYFQYCTREDGDSWVHRDLDDFDKTHVGVIYLTPDPPPQSGTIIYQPPAELAHIDDLNPDTDYPVDPAAYDVKQVVDNRFNRLVVYKPTDFHKSDNYFGDSLQDGRLFIVFFMRVGSSPI